MTGGLYHIGTKAQKGRAFVLLLLCLCAAALLAWALPGGRGARPLGEEELDAELLRAAEEALGGREGAVLVMDAQTGRLRAVVNRRLAFETATPPGSAVKPFTMLTALRLGSLGEGAARSCPGAYERGELRLACAHPRHDTPLGAARAIADSCNNYFGRLAEAVDGRDFDATLAAFGFGERTRGGGDREAAGERPRAGAQVADMLGESERIRVTPAQLLTAYTALFNGGRRFVPREAAPRGFEPEELDRAAVPDDHRRLLFEGMRGAVTQGTASGAGLAGLPLRVFGKTGTSTPSEHWRPQGWFVGLAAEATNDEKRTPAPAEVKLAVVVLLKRASGSQAAEVSRPVFEAYADALARRQLAAREGKAADGAASPLSPAGAGGPAAVRVRVSRAGATLALPLEDYVFGVLAAEGSVETEPEALKALAVAARTYALHNLRRHSRAGFDFCDTTHCQRFAPVADEAARPDFYDVLLRAVRETAGEALFDPAGRVAESYFSASCGGSTTVPSKLWGGPASPAHLRGVRDESCAAAGGAWTDVIPRGRLLAALRTDERSDVGARLDHVRVARRDSSGRAELVVLEGERRRLLRGWDFKIIVGRSLGWNVLKSSRFEVARSGDAFVFRGRGFGHGLGLCQAGAHTLASRGAPYRQILDKYFPGARIRAIDERDAGSRSAFRTASFVSENDGGSSLIINAGAVAPTQRQTLSSENFRVSLPARSPRRDAEEALRALESARAELVRRLSRAGLGDALAGDVELFVHETTGDFTSATSQPAWVGAVTTGRRIDSQPLELLRRRGVLLSTLRHEAVHAACESLGRGRAPRWLVEGLAAHVAGEGAALARSAPKAAMTLEEIERGLEGRPASAARARELYAAAYAEVLKLIRREGEAALWRRVARG